MTAALTDTNRAAVDAVLQGCAAQVAQDTAAGPLTAALTDAERVRLDVVLRDHAARQVARGTDPGRGWALLGSLLALAPGEYETPAGTVTVKVYR
jgi:hypothetical protein